MAPLLRWMSFAHRPAAAWRSRRRPSSTRLAGLERLEAKTPLTVEASLSGGLLTLNYLYPTDAATLAFGSDGTFMVTGDVSGTTSGSSAEVTQIFVMNLGNLEGIPFEYDSTQFTITGSTSVAAGLIIGDFAGSNGGIQTVTLSVPGFTTNGAAFSVVAGTLTIAGQIDTSGASGGAGGGTAGAVTIMALSGGISLPSAIIATGGDGSAGGGSGGGVALVASGAIAVDGAIEASGGSGGTAGGNGGAVKITAGTSVVVSGAIETFGMGGGTEGGSGGAVTITAGTSATVGGDIETQGGSGGTAGGSGGAVTIMAGEAISTEAINAASGGRYATAGVVTIDQDDPDVTSAVTSFALRSAARPSGGVAVGRITGGDVSVRAVSGAIYLVGDMILNGEASFDGPVELGLPIRVDTSFESGGVTFTSTVDGRRPLVVAAGTGAVSFQGAVGAARPLAGLRLASAGSVTAAGQVHVTGGVAGALRHGIEIAPSARNVNLAQGGSIRGFRSGQAIHAPGGSAGSTVSNFRIVNSGRPFVGYSADGVTTLGSNQVVAPVVRWATDRITTPAGRTNDSTPTLSGTARSGDQVTLYADGVPVGSTIAVNGRWSITSAAVADGRRSFAVRALSPAGVAAEFSKPVILSIKTALPATPTVGLAAASDSGIPGDMTTTDTRPVLTGTAAPGTRVRVTLDGRVQGPVTATPQGTWRLPVTAGIPGGADREVRAVSVTATDPFGNVSAAASATLTTLRFDDPVLLPAAEGSVFNPNFSVTTTSGGEYVLTGSFSNATAPASGWPVVLVYHGGGESAQEILEYSGLSALSAVVISLQGQPSINGHSWMNAFPWLHDNPRDDVAFTEQVIEEVAAQLPIDRSRIYATGKSDGGGMSVFLAAHPELRDFSVAAIAPVAGAYFGRSQTIGRETYSLPSDAADYGDIILAARQVPVLEMHGTADQVMPYDGGQFTTALALQNYGQPGSFWGPANGFTNNVAYTASIESYWATWARSVNGATDFQTRPFTNSTTQQATLYQFMQVGALPLQHLQVAGANHDWFGHGDSGPGSTTAASLHLDATQVVADFFRIPLRNYTSPVTTGTPTLPMVSTPAGVIDLSAAKLASPTSTWVSLAGVLSQRGPVKGVLGVFRMDDISGRITDPSTGQSLVPGDTGWATAALSASRSAGRIRLDPKLPAARDVTLALETGGIYGTFVAVPRPGGQLRTSVSSEAAQDVTFSLPAANDVSPQFVFDSIKNQLIVRSGERQAGEDPSRAISISFTSMKVQFTPYDPQT